MKLKALMLIAVLALTPTAALADWNFGHFQGFFEKIRIYFQTHRDWTSGSSDGHENPVPEPSGALVMGAGLTVAALARRRNRN